MACLKDRWSCISFSLYALLKHANIFWPVEKIQRKTRQWKEIKGSRLSSRTTGILLTRAGGDLLGSAFLVFLFQFVLFVFRLGQNRVCSIFFISIDNPKPIRWAIPRQEKHPAWFLPDFRLLSCALRIDPAFVSLQGITKPTCQAVGPWTMRCLWSGLAGCFGLLLDLNSPLPIFNLLYPFGFYFYYFGWSSCWPVLFEAVFLGKSSQLLLLSGISNRPAIRHGKKTITKSNTKNHNVSTIQGWISITSPNKSSQEPNPAKIPYFSLLSRIFNAFLEYFFIFQGVSLTGAGKIL